MHKTFAILKSKNKNMDVENIIRKIKLGISLSIWI